jgi:hypothetical protein
MNEDSQVAVTDIINAFKETIADQAEVIAILKATIASMSREAQKSDGVK